MNDGGGGGGGGGDDGRFLRCVNAGSTWPNRSTASHGLMAARGRRSGDVSGAGAPRGHDVRSSESSSALERRAAPATDESSDRFVLT